MEIGLSTLKSLKKEEMLEFIKNYFEPNIIKRGLKYAEEGRVIRKGYLNPNYIYGEILGNQLYKAEVTYLNGNLYTNCTCPYGQFCKHAVAILLHDENEENLRKKDIDPEKFLKNLLNELLSTGIFISFHEEEWKYIIQTTDKSKIWSLLINFCKELFENIEDSLKYDEHMPLIDDLLVPFIEALENGNRAKFFLDIYYVFDEYLILGNYATFFKLFDELDKKILETYIDKTVYLKENPFVLSFLNNS